uniref:Uncharacterized protein n=1 Tax=Chromera velia CCMP2878 TaxID=1169474 RepID=A0A0G4HL71_9ALVE|eukprot:Cvel_7313.t1-p1 / transcript=Cvel_7313.t1 / gene=Cvel_7313 / organism=Chromera_velia_CCMP2878 / gene_product=hypothetical protein / transcript_product=hypothetical protein / location=Cvel_scaffold379:22639-23514(+) / protein_length=292 / sequence_SO=supercontig / SO=protein_coding / is_pseudo=false
MCGWVRCALCLIFLARPVDCLRRDGLRNLKCEHPDNGCHPDCSPHGVISKLARSPDQAARFRKCLAWVAERYEEKPKAELPVAIAHYIIAQDLKTEVFTLGVSAYTSIATSMAKKAIWGPDVITSMSTSSRAWDAIREKDKEWYHETFGKYVAKAEDYIWHNTPESVTRAQAHEMAETLIHLLRYDGPADVASLTLEGLLKRAISKSTLRFLTTVVGTYINKMFFDESVSRFRELMQRDIQSYPKSDNTANNAARAVHNACGHYRVDWVGSDYEICAAEPVSACVNSCTLWL